MEESLGIGAIEGRQGDTDRGPHIEMSPPPGDRGRQPRDRFLGDPAQGIVVAVVRDKQSKFVTA